MRYHSVEYNLLTIIENSKSKYITSSEICTILSEIESYTYNITTVCTMLSRLLKKEYVFMHRQALVRKQKGNPPCFYSITYLGQLTIIDSYKNYILVQKKQNSYVYSL